MASIPLNEPSMELHSNSFKSYFEKYSEEIKGCASDQVSFTTLDQYRLLPGQAIYVVDWKELGVTYQRGINRLLGYNPVEFNHDLLSGFCHPDDIERYVHLVKISNDWARELKPEPFSVEASIDYRIRKKDGSYLKVLRQSTVFESCLNRSIKSAFMVLTDISRIKTDTSVNLSVINLNSGRVFLEDEDCTSELPKFTKREKEILVKVKDGYDSKAIAGALFISHHTVDTHRRRMLSKTICKNVVELVQYCIRMGVI